jgi:hypothetical protein
MAAWPVRRSDNPTDQDHIHSHAGVDQALAPPPWRSRHQVVGRCVDAGDQRGARVGHEGDPQQLRRQHRQSHLCIAHRSAQLEARMRGLNAKKTSGGLVVTIGDVPAIAIRTQAVAARVLSASARTHAPDHPICSIRCTPGLRAASTGA